MQSTKVSSRAAERLILEIRTRICAGETYYCSCSADLLLTPEHNQYFPIPSLYLYRRYTEGIPNKHHFNYAQYSTQKSSHTPTIFWRIRQGIAHYGSVCKSRTWVLFGRKTSQRDYCWKKIASGELRQQKIDFITTFAVSFEGYGTYTKGIQNVGANLTPVINQLNLNFNLSQDRSLRC